MYPTIDQVRKLLPTLLMDDDDIGPSFSGTNLTLNYPAFDVPTILIDGVSSTAFTFSRPDKIALTEAATGQRFIAQVYKGIPDADLTALISTSDRHIRAFFTGYDLPSAEYLADWSGMLTVARYLRLYATATEENITKAEGLEKLVKDDMESFRVEVASSSSKILIKVNA